MPHFMREGDTNLQPKDANEDRITQILDDIEDLKVQLNNIIQMMQKPTVTAAPVVPAAVPATSLTPVPLEPVAYPAPEVPPVMPPIDESAPIEPVNVIEPGLPQPPVSNEYVAEGAEQFREPVAENYEHNGEHHDNPTQEELFG